MEDNVSVEAVDSGADITMDDNHSVETTHNDVAEDGRSLDDFLVDESEDEDDYIDEPEMSEDTLQEVAPEAPETPSITDEVSPAATDEITQERIEQYFKSDEVHNALHNELITSDPDYKTACSLLEDSNTLQQFLNQVNPTFANTQNLDEKVTILHQAQLLLRDQVETTRTRSAENYKAQASDYIAAQQLGKYLNDNAANLNGVNKLTGDLYNTIVSKASLPNDDKTRAEVGTAINNVFLGLSRQYNIHPAELVKVIENFGSNKDAQAALNNLQNTSKAKAVAREQAKSITRGGATNVNSKRNEFEDILKQYAI